MRSSEYLLSVGSSPRCSIKSKATTGTSPPSERSVARHGAPLSRRCNAGATRQPTLTFRRRMVPWVSSMKRIKIGLVVFPGFQLLDIAGPRDAFGEVKVLSRGECEYEMLTVGTTRGTVQSSSGLTVTPDRTIFDVCPEFDTIIVPGGLGIFNTFDDPALSEWLRQQHRRARRLCAICNGLFALGPAGLLDNRVVTTHWMDVPRLSATFPKARIEPDHIYVNDGS